MKKNIILTAIILIVGVLMSLSSFSVMGPTDAFAQSSRKVLMIPREGDSTDLDLMITKEVGVMTALLKNAGFEVDIATPSGQPFLGPTKKIEKVLRLSKIDPNNYAGIIMPCMAMGAFPGPAVPPETVAVVKKALSDGKPVAAAYGSIIILAEAGLLKGKKYAFPHDALKTEEQHKPDLRFKDAIYSGPGVVQDGKIITSGVCPNIEKQYGMTYGWKDGTVELTQKFIAAIGSK